MPSPQEHRLPDMPAAVTIYEVGPRDGLQNEQTAVPTPVKAELVRRLVDAGLKVVEVTSLVRPDLVPQLADAEALIAALPPLPEARLPVLVPNARGLRRAAALGVRDIAIFGSATETFAQRNLGRGYDEQFAMFEPVVTAALQQGMRVRGYLSMCFGDPWEGRVPLERVVTAGVRLLELGCDQLSLGDTIGVATSGHVVELLAEFAAAGVGVERLAVHFHDTYGQALANSLAAIRAGVTTVDASAGGLGGCPFAKSATGNLATEDLVWALHGLGVRTCVDLEKLVAASVWLAGELGRPSPSRVVRALSGG